MIRNAVFLAVVLSICAGCSGQESRRKTIEQAKITVASLEQKVADIEAAGGDPELLRDTKAALDVARDVLKAAEEANENQFGNAVGSILGTLLAVGLGIAGRRS